MTRPANLTIFQESFNLNLQELRKFTKNARIWACVKAGGYGHGIDSTIRGFDDADGLALLELEEAYEARHLGWKKPLLLLEGVFHKSELDEVISLGLEIVIHSNEQLDWCLDFKGKFTSIWIKINSGMNRLGFSSNEISDKNIISLQKKINKLREKILSRNGLRWLTHFSSGDILTKCKNQEKKFKKIISSLGYERGELVSFGNSSALVCNRSFSLDWVRPGILLYGAPSSNNPPKLMQLTLKNLTACQSLVTRIVSIQHVKANEYVGYGESFKAYADMKIGIAAVGYADGYPRSAAQGTVVLVDGNRCPIVGVVSMDLITIDLSNAPMSRVGSIVECWGKNLSILELAKSSNRLCYELFTGVTARVRRSIL